MDTQAILLSADEAAELVRMPRGRFVRLAKNGALPIVDLGDGKPRFDRSDLEAWAASCKQPSRGAPDAK